MRKLIFSILLASAAASPALAQDHGRWHQDNEGDRQAAHEQRQEQHQQAREQRSNGGGEPARVQQQVQPLAQPQIEARRQQWQGGNAGSGQRNEAQQQPQWQGRGGWDRNNAQAQVQAQQEQHRQFDRAGHDGFDARQREQTGQWQGQRYQGQNYQGQTYQGQRYQGQNYQGQNYQGQRWSQSGQWNQGSRWSGNWNRDWRNDRRYDWRRYRDSHRSIFRIGIYYDPFGYGYRQFDIGYQLSPAYFGQQYWIDPAMYQLPYPPPGTTWVRYWNDALLVDMYTGQVVDVIHDFFW
jgi:Ni/Co efflux regulator RcnB